MKIITIEDIQRDGLLPSFAGEVLATDQMSLGALIAALKRTENEADKVVTFDFCGVAPDGIQSWRGNYAHLAIGWKDYTYHNRPLLSHTIRVLEDSLGHTFEGYKGGNYTARAGTPVWVANWGTSGHTAIVGVRDDGYQTIILTGYREMGGS